MIRLNLMTWVAGGISTPHNTVDALLGITEDVAIQLFYSQVKLQQDMPFSIPNRETMDAMNEVNQSKNLTSYDSFEDWEQSLTQNI